MLHAFDLALAALAVLLLAAVLTSRISDRFGIPALLLFLALGMLAGSEGPGGIYFDDASLAQHIGIVALILILFSGGLDTDWRQTRPVLKYGLLLSTVGVAVTTALVGLPAAWVLGISLQQGLLLGAIVSSTDAAAVFSILRSRGIGLKGPLGPLLEFESGSNDPMAVFLTVSLVGLLTQPETSIPGLALRFLLQMAAGAAVGYGMGRAIVWLTNRLQLRFEGLYPVLTLSLVMLAYGLATAIGGNGFLAVYLAGLTAGNREFIHKRSLLRFHDGLAWLMQIAMFLALGLLVFPSRLVPVGGAGLLIAAGLILVARPASVFISLAIGPFRPRDKLFLSWVGLRGAVPIILATYPLLAGVPGAAQIFNVVFFVVLASVLIQGTTVTLAARVLDVQAPQPPRRARPIEMTPTSGLPADVHEIDLPAGSAAAGKALVDVGLPGGLLILLIERDGEYVVPGGGTILEAGDRLLALAERPVLEEGMERLRGRPPLARGGAG